MTIYKHHCVNVLFPENNFYSQKVFCAQIIKNGLMDDKDIFMALLSICKPFLAVRCPFDIKFHTYNIIKGSPKRNIIKQH